MGIASSLARGTPRPVSSRLALAAKDEKGRVEIDYDKCIGCRFCMAVCPYNARVFNWSEPDHDPDFQTGFKDVPVRPRGVMEKCTLCKERCDADPDNEPMCAVCCPSSARVYGDLDAPNSEISKIGQQVFGLGITGMSNGTSWAAMAVPDNDKGVHGMQRLEAYARAAAENAEADATGALVYSDDPAVAGMIATSVEFMRLFIGPPRPAADPRETANDPYNDKKVGYGRATVAMQQLLAAEGLELGGENNRFEDHMGIELLYLSAPSGPKATTPRFSSMSTGCWTTTTTRWCSALSALSLRGMRGSATLFARGMARCKTCNANCTECNDSPACSAV